MMREKECMENELHAIKTTEEIAKLRMAARFTQQILTEILPFIKPGVAEIDIAEEIGSKTRRMGLEPSFDTIVAGGENGAEPHAVPSARKFALGDMITIDLGCKYEGYCGDMTRTFALGFAAREFKIIYETVKNAQKAGLLAVSDGIICRNVDAVSRNIIAQAGFGEYFIHGTGHGVGREVHEYPRVNASSDVMLQKNMVITIEPGIYIPGMGGVRIEDTVVVGGGNFFDFTKELIIL